MILIGMTVAVGRHQKLACTMANVRAQTTHHLDGEEEQHAKSSCFPECAVAHLGKLWVWVGSVKSFADVTSFLAWKVGCVSMAAHAFSPYQ